MRVRHALLVRPKSGPELSPCLSHRNNSAQAPPHGLNSKGSPGLTDTDRSERSKRMSGVAPIQSHADIDFFYKF